MKLLVIFLILFILIDAPLVLFNLINCDLKNDENIIAYQKGFDDGTNSYVTNSTEILNEAIRYKARNENVEELTLFEYLLSDYSIIDYEKRKLEIIESNYYNGVYDGYMHNAVYYKNSNKMNTLINISI